MGYGTKSYLVDPSRSMQRSSGFGVPLALPQRLVDVSVACTVVVDEPTDKVHVDSAVVWVMVLLLVLAAIETGLEGDLEMSKFTLPVIRVLFDVAVNADLSLVGNAGRVGAQVESAAAAISIAAVASVVVLVGGVAAASGSVAATAALTRISLHDGVASLAVEAFEMATSNSRLRIISASLPRGLRTDFRLSSRSPRPWRH